MSILIAEDNDLQARALRRELEEMGHEVSRARDGAEALELIRASSPTAVILDLKMPNVSGWDAIEEIRSDPELEELPVIAVSAFALPGDLERAMAMGATDAMPKPLDVVALEERLQELTAAAADDV